MAGRHFHLSNGSLFFTWLIAGVVLLLLPKDKTSKVWDVFRKTFDPVLKIGRNINDEYPPMPLNPDEAVTGEQYKELWKDYNNLKATLRELHNDYDKLASIRSQIPHPYGGLVIAQVIGTLSSYRHDVVINKGSSDGIKTGQYVLSAKKNSVVGVVLESSDRYAKVRVLTDSKQSIEIRIVNEAKERDIPGLMFGNGKSACKIKMIEWEKKVEVGDVVFAAAKPGYLNVPVVIGEVADVVRDDKHPLLWDITVQPAEDMTRLDDVAVIVIEDF
ncbi:MAG: rod shape-determining protein MreC [Phycisphaerae bacterium]|nr:rod shape-determining protein MreC [Phycisphaerae bacterium]